MTISVFINSGQLQLFIQKIMNYVTGQASSHSLSLIKINIKKTVCDVVQEGKQNVIKNNYTSVIISQHCTVQLFPEHTINIKS